ncbi:MAG: DUF5652 family protein [Candidatus Paceibacterota bacterium]
MKGKRDIIRSMEAFIEQNALLILLIILWTLPWKGWALWLSARNYHRGWFVVILITSTLAILDIIYIFFIGRPGYEKLQKEN